MKNLTGVGVIRSLVAAAAALIAIAIPASAQRQVYVVNVSQQFGVVDLDTGAFRQIGQPTPEGQANLVWGPAGNLLSLTVSGTLDAIDPQTGATTVIGATGLGYNAFDLAEVRGKLYMTDFSNNLYSVDSRTGAATLIGPTGIPADPNVPFTINPDGTLNLCDESLYGVDGKLYATFDSFTVDPNTLAITTVVSAKLYEIDPQTGVATEIAPTMLGIGATVEQNGRFYALVSSITGFSYGFPVGQTAVYTFDRNNAGTIFKVNVDPAAGAIVGAAPVLGRR